MNRRLICWMLYLVTISAVAQQPVAEPVPLTDIQRIRQSAVALASKNIVEAVKMAEGIKNDAARLYLLALTHQADGKPEEALKKAAEVVAFHYHDMDWLPRSELLCAELYIEMGMTNTAETIVRQIQQLYAGTLTAEKATVLKARITNVEQEISK